MTSAQVVRLPGWAPRLAQQHPGYFKVVVSLLLTHFALALDVLHVDTGSSHAFKIVSDALGGNLWVLATVHFVVFILIIVGLYVKGCFFLLRCGCALSAVLFNLLAVGFIAAAYDYNTSYVAAIMSVAISLSSVAAAKEPETGPAGANR